MSIYDNLPTLNSWYCHEQQQQLQQQQKQQSAICGSSLSACSVLNSAKKPRSSHNRNVSFATDPPEIHYLAVHSTSLSSCSPVSNSTNKNVKSRLKRYAFKLSTKSS